VQSLYESAETGKPIEIPPYQPAQRPSGRQRIDRPPVRKPDMVATSSPTE